MTNFKIFLSSQISGKPYFISYLPQHCLYFFPLPHASQISIFSIFIVLWIFPLFSRVCGQVIFCIFCTIFAIFYIKYSSNVHKMCTNPSISYIFFVIYIIYNNQYLSKSIFCCCIFLNFTILN